MVHDVAKRRITRRRENRDEAQPRMEAAAKAEKRKISFASVDSGTVEQCIEATVGGCSSGWAVWIRIGACQGEGYQEAAGAGGKKRGRNHFYLYL